MLQISSLSLFAIEVEDGIRRRDVEMERRRGLLKRDEVLKERMKLWDGELVLGLCPEGVQEGDTVALLRGCGSSVALREVQVDTTGEEELADGRYYWFVGGCYIQG